MCSISLSYARTAPWVILCSTRNFLSLGSHHTIHILLEASSIILPLLLQLLVLPDNCCTGWPRAMLLRVSSLQVQETQAG